MTDEGDRLIYRLKKTKSEIRIEEISEILSVIQSEQMGDKGIQDLIMELATLTNYDMYKDCT